MENTAPIDPCGWCGASLKGKDPKETVATATQFFCNEACCKEWDKHSKTYKCLSDRLAMSKEELTKRDRDGVTKSY